jgi:hypothetical protein
MEGNQYETLVLRKKLTKAEEARQGNTSTVAKFGAGKNVQNKSDANKAKIDREEVALVKSPKEMQMEIMQKRNELKKTQDQLDQDCGFPKGTTKSYENGTAVINSVHLSKINRVLGLALKKPKVKIAPPED